MQVLDSIDALRLARRDLPGAVGFVPTMGFLHDGHLELMRQANQRCDHLVVSIFVNPTQFGPGEDLDAYPRDPEGDRQKCEQLGCELLFMPTPDMMYAADHSTTVEVSGLDQVLCGPRRPGHFRGVTTVVSKLFNIVQPDVAVFGQKDYQQLAIVRRMVRDLNFPVDIVGVPTVREADGLAILESQQVPRRRPAPPGDLPVPGASPRLAGLPRRGARRRRAGRGRAPTPPADRRRRRHRLRRMRPPRHPGALRPGRAPRRPGRRRRRRHGRSDGPRAPHRQPQA